MPRLCSRPGWSALRAILLCLLFAGLRNDCMAQQVQVTLDPAQTKITISVQDVHGGFQGSFRLTRGLVTFDRSTGKASGEIVVDAKSGDTGIQKRNRKMNNEVLESDRYPQIVFVPKRVIGNVAAQGSSNIEIQGIFRVHGADHDLTLPAAVQVSGDRVTATTNFVVPYESWGMKNPSILFLHVDGKAEVTVSAAGRIASTNPTR